MTRGAPMSGRKRRMWPVCTYCAEVARHEGGGQCHRCGCGSFTMAFSEFEACEAAWRMRDRALAAGYQPPLPPPLELWDSRTLVFPEVAP